MTNDRKKTPAPSELADKFMLRLPEGMRDQIALRAKENGRSMNSEIVAILQRSLAAPQLKLKRDARFEVAREEPTREQLLDEEYVVSKIQELDRTISELIDSQFELADSAKNAMRERDAAIENLKKKMTGLRHKE